MLTAKGKTFIKRYLAGQAGNVVGAISIGVGGTAATLNDTKLQFEFARIPIDVIAYDFATDKLVFKGSLDENVVGKIYEIGLWTAEVNTAAGNQASRMITNFDSETEDWTNETVESTIARIGVDSLKHTPAASATTSSILSGVAFEFNESSSLDTFVLAYNNENAFCSSLVFRLRTDASNYYSFTVSSPAVAYGFASFTKGSATVTGTPNWADINDIEVRTTATAGGSASVEWDGIRLEDVDTIAPEYGLVARYVPPSPITKVSGRVQDVEYALSVSL